MQLAELILECLFAHNSKRRQLLYLCQPTTFPFQVDVVSRARDKFAKLEFHERGMVVRPKGSYERNIHRLQVSVCAMKLRISSTYLTEAGIAYLAVSSQASRTYMELLTKSERYNIAKGLTVARLPEDSH